MSQDSEKLLAAYERRYIREKAARDKAEKQLEVYSRKIYSSNQTLIRHAKESREQQRNLAFLSDISQAHINNVNAHALFKNYLNRLVEYLTEAHVFIIESVEDFQINEPQVLYPDDLEDTFFEFKLTSEFVRPWLNLHSIKHHIAEHYQGKDLTRLVEMPEYNHFRILILPLHLVQSKGDVTGAVCICFVNKDDFNEQIKLPVLQSSVNILRTALDRLAAESSLKQRLEQVLEQNEQISQYQKQLVESEKLASLGLLSAGVAHEINNPVGFIRSNADVMQDYISELAEALKDIDSVSGLEAEKIVAKLQEIDIGFLLKDSQSILDSSINGLDRIKEIVADLRQFSRMDGEVEHHEVELDKVLKQSLNMLQNELKYDYEVTVDIESPAVIWGAEGPLQQVFVNFLINAKQAMPDGGKIEISCKMETQRRVVRIKDQGVGIAEEHLPELFTPFFTTKPVGQGTGLGLSISYSILQQHHAKVTVNSEVGKGTEFALSFIPVL
jgi:signal transduction histidine kinase